MDNIKTIKSGETISLKELENYRLWYWDIVKGVVDIELWDLVVGWDLHSDEEKLLLKSWSKQCFLWGINFYIEKYWTDEFVEFDSMINIRPRENNKSRYVENEKNREAIISIINLLIKK